MTDHRAQIIAELEVLRLVAATESAGVFKQRSYATAIKAVQAWPPIASIDDVPAAAKGDGIGKEIRKKIERIVTEGSLDISEAVRTTAAALELFQNIYGVGPKKAEDLIKAGFTTIADLRLAATETPKLFTKNQHIGLRYYEQLLERIPRAEMDAHAAQLMATKPAALEGVIVGSYRRGRPDSGDIDMLVRTTSAAVDAGAALKEYVVALTTAGYIKEILALGPSKCLAISQLPGKSYVASSSAAGSCPARRLDLLVTPPEEFPFAVFYFTGSDTFNVAVRSHALTRGYTLNEHALTRVSDGTPVKGIKTERDIFTVLKLVWREPPDRTGPEAVHVIQ
jgi:DNA polymerase/3'-5' exonuclease PolX